MRVPNMTYAMGSGRGEPNNEEIPAMSTDVSQFESAIEEGTSHEGLRAWVRDIAALTKPDAVHFCDGTDEEWDTMTSKLVDAGTFTRLNDEKKPRSFHSVSDPSDVARVEDRTFICSENERDAGPTNHWMAPADMKKTMSDLYDGCMKGRTLYVIPFVMGPLDHDTPMYGVEITDSEYVVACMRVMTNMDHAVLEKIEATNADFVKCLHSVGAPLEEGQKDAVWPCNETKYISHFPETREVWSFGSGYGGNALLGKKCYALRIASAVAHKEGWMAEHMLVLKLTSPENKVHYVAAAFPSACGKTNLAMLEPTIPGWKVETLGDDIAWMRFGEDGRLYAVNPEAGFFGVAPGTNETTNGNAIRTMDKGNSIFTNVALTEDGDVWWEGLENPPAKATSWLGNPWTPESDEKSSHPNSRYCTPISQCPILADEYTSPQGVPIDAILFGGRRASVVPLVTEARDWTHGTFFASTLSSETTAAATGAVGVVRRDPMAMLPFIGYNAGDYMQHWINIGNKEGAKLPKVFLVNWFRKDEDGKFLWPGFSENSRVLKWVIDRLDGNVDAVETPIGHIPAEGALNVDGLDISAEDVAAATAFSADEWKKELPLIEEWYAKFGDDLPKELRAELETLKARLDA